MGLSAGGLGAAAITFGVRLLTTYVISNLLLRKDDTPKQPSDGSRIQLPPATTNVLPMVYGKAWVKPIIVDAKISQSNKTMWYVCALSEVPDGEQFSIGKIIWGDKTLNFDTSDKTKVVSWTDATGTTETKVNGYINVYRYGNGSNMPVNGTTQTAITVLNDTLISASERWQYTDVMSNTAFLIVRVGYNQDIPLTGLEQLTVELDSPVTGTGNVILDYLTNERYGCAIPLDQIDTTSLDNLTAYSQQQISYTGGSSSSMNRYNLNGVINPSNNCFSNLQQLTECCDSWLQWNEASGKWGVVINKAYDETAGTDTAKTVSELFKINDNNIISPISLNPVDLNGSFNRIEASYPDTNIYDATSYAYIDLDAEDRSPNEPNNVYNLSLPFVNNSVHAQYIATRRLIQSREDLVVTVTIDYSGIQIDAGDIVSFDSERYQWTDKLFRVTQVQETKDESGFLSVSLTLIEYNEQVYDNISISQYTPSPNIGVVNPNNIGTPAAPIAVFNKAATSGSVNNIYVTGVVPSTGLVTSMDFYIGHTANVLQHKLYRKITSDTDIYWTAGDVAKMTVTEFEPRSYDVVSISKSNPALVSTSTAHGLVTGDTVFLYHPNGMPEIAGKTSTVTVVNSTSFTMDGVDSSTYSTYVDNAVVACPVWISLRASNEVSVSSYSAATKITWSGPAIGPQSITTNELAPKAVTSENIADGAIKAAAIAAGAIGAIALADKIITAAKMSDGIIDTISNDIKSLWSGSGNGLTSTVSSIGGEETTEIEFFENDWFEIPGTATESLSFTSTDTLHLDATYSGIIKYSTLNPNLAACIVSLGIGYRISPDTEWSRLTPVIVSSVESADANAYSAYDEGYHTGENDGFVYGYHDGYDNLTKNDHPAALDAMVASDEFKRGFRKGFNTGYYDGWAEGKTASAAGAPEYGWYIVDPFKGDDQSLVKSDASYEPSMAISGARLFAGSDGSAEFCLMLKVDPIQFNTEASEENFRLLTNGFCVKAMKVSV
jgi:hypothetical protein